MAVTEENGAARTYTVTVARGPPRPNSVATGALSISGTARVEETLTSDNSGIAAVSIVPPATTDCNATGAICTKDGRTLSNRLVFTINGPNGYSRDRKGRNAWPIRQGWEALWQPPAPYRSPGRCRQNNLLQVWEIGRM